MKKTNVLIGIAGVLSLFLISFLFSGCSTLGYQGYDSSVQNGYDLDELNSYGEWVNVNNYGNAWRPYAVSDWAPFENGHWTSSTGEWTWVSYEPFGWIVYHYGYWFDDPNYGWVWIPSDNDWSPARVMWMNYDDYVSWAPLPPNGITYGNPWEANENRHWRSVKSSDFTNDNIRAFRVNNQRVNESSFRKNVINKPPDRNGIEKVTGRKIVDINIQHEPVKLQKGEIHKMNLPQQENKRVEQHTERIKKEVLVPKEEFKRQKSQSNSERNNKK